MVKIVFAPLPKTFCTAHTFGPRNEIILFDLTLEQFNMFLNEIFIFKKFQLVADLIKIS